MNVTLNISQIQVDDHHVQSLTSDVKTLPPPPKKKKRDKYGKPYKVGPYAVTSI